MFSEGVVRHLAGLKLIGETHESDRLLNADIDLVKPLEGNVSRILLRACSIVLKQFACRHSMSSEMNDRFGMHSMSSRQSLTKMPSYCYSATFRTTNVPNRYQLLVVGPEYQEISEECSRAGLEELQTIINKITGRPDLVISKIHFKADWR